MRDLRPTSPGRLVGQPEIHLHDETIVCIRVEHRPYISTEIEVSGAGTARLTALPDEEDRRARTVFPTQHGRGAEGPDIEVTILK